MVPVAPTSLEAGIWLTHVGDPLAHGQECRFHSASSDRLAGAPGVGAPSTEGEDEKETEPRFGVVDVTQGGVLSVRGAELDPGLEGVEAGAASLGHDRGVSGLQHRAEIRSEAISGRRVCSDQVGGSGYCFVR